MNQLLDIPFGLTSTALILYALDVIILGGIGGVSLLILTKNAEKASVARMTSFLFIFSFAGIVGASIITIVRYFYA